MIKAEADCGYSGSLGCLLAVTLPDDKRPEMWEALRDFALLGIARHALVIGRDPQHLIACILHAQTACDGAALKCPFPAPSAFGYCNW
jgi:hypothetical protein